MYKKQVVVEYEYNPNGLIPGSISMASVDGNGESYYLKGALAACFAKLASEDGCATAHFETPFGDVAFSKERMLPVGVEASMNFGGTSEGESNEK